MVAMQVLGGIKAMVDAGGVTIPTGGEGMDAVISSMNTALTTVSTNAMSVIQTVLPAALTVVGATLVVTIGIKVFKKIAGK